LTASRLARVLGERVQPFDLALALDPRRLSGGKRGDQALDPVADLKREVGGRRAGEGADVVDRYLAA